MEPLSPSDLALRQALEILNATIHDLCVRRDILASQLPDAPKQKARKFLSCGLEIKPGGGKKRKATP